MSSPCPRLFPIAFLIACLAVTGCSSSDGNSGSDAADDVSSSDGQNEAEPSDTGSGDVQEPDSDAGEDGPVDVGEEDESDLAETDSRDDAGDSGESDASEDGTDDIGESDTASDADSEGDETADTEDGNLADTTDSSDLADTTDADATDEFDTDSADTGSDPDVDLSDPDVGHITCYSDEDGDGLAGTSQTVSASTSCADHNTDGRPWATESADNCDNRPNPGQEDVCDVWFVTADGGVDGDGYAWATSFGDIQQAIDIADAGDQIWVASGTYRPPTANAPVAEISTELSLYGGFDGSEMTLADRAGDFEGTILSGDYAVDDTDQLESLSDNSEHVVAVFADDVIVDGFLATAGYLVEETWPSNSGAGVHVSRAERVSLTNLTIEGNRSASDRLGALGIALASATVADTTIRGNHGGHGGAIYLHASSRQVLVRNVTVTGNTNTGQVIQVYNTSAVFEFLTVHGNPGSPQLLQFNSGTLSVRNSVLYSGSGNSLTGTLDGQTIEYNCVDQDLSTYSSSNVHLDGSSAAFGDPILEVDGYLLLNHVEAEQDVTSACVDAADAATAGTTFPDWNSLTTRSDGVIDGSADTPDDPDCGRHYNPEALEAGTSLTELEVSYYHLDSGDCSGDDEIFVYVEGELVGSELTHVVLGDEELPLVNAINDELFAEEISFCVPDWITTRDGDSWFDFALSDGSNASNAINQFFPALDRLLIIAAWQNSDYLEELGRTLFTRPAFHLSSGSVATRETMAEYDCVFTYGDGNDVYSADGEALGDELAAYLAGGGTLLIGRLTSSAYDAERGGWFGLGGDIIDDLPFTSFPSSVSTSDQWSYNDDGTGDILSGVESLTSSTMIKNPVLHANGSTDGTFGSGGHVGPVVIERSDLDLVFLNGTPHDSSKRQEGWLRLVRNACGFVEPI